jgi:hypothetical protein
VDHVLVCPLYLTSSNFPAIQEKRWHVEPAHSVTFISDVQKVDEGIYSCIATNKDGSVTSSARGKATKIDYLFTILRILFKKFGIWEHQKYAKGK